MVSALSPPSQNSYMQSVGDMNEHAQLHFADSTPSVLMNVACPDAIPVSAIRCLLSGAGHLSHPLYACSLKGYAVQQHDCACLWSHAAGATIALLDVPCELAPGSMRMSMSPVSSDICARERQIPCIYQKQSAQMKSHGVRSTRRGVAGHLARC